MLEVENAAFSYDKKTPVFKKVGFNVKEGEIVSILGPNGAGKSTLLKCITRVLAFSSGSVMIDNRAMSSLSRKMSARLVGYVSQTEEAGFPFSVFETVLMGRAAHLNIFKKPGKNDRKIAMEALKYLGIGHLESRVYNELSGGESQLVTIARALAAEPKVLILDEPTSHLDLKNQMIVFNALVRLSREKGLAVLMTTHQPDHAMVFSNQVLLMKMDGTALFGDTAHIVTERNIRNVFAVDVNILPVRTNRHTVTTIVPDWRMILPGRE